MFYKWGWKSPDDFNNNKHIYINWYNKRYNKLGEVKESLFTKVAYRQVDENLLIHLKRKVNGGIVRFNKKYYVPYDEYGNRVLMKEKSNVILCYNKDNELFFKGNGKLYRADEPKGKSLTDYELYCIRNNIDIGDEISIQYHKLYKKNLEIIKSINKSKEQLKNSWKLYHQKIFELKRREEQIQSLNNTK